MIRKHVTAGVALAMLVIGQSATASTAGMNAARTSQVGQGVSSNRAALGISGTPVAADCVSTDGTVRAGCGLEGASDLRGRGGTGTIFVALFALAAIIAGIAAAAGNDDEPVSP